MEEVSPHETLKSTTMTEGALAQHENNMAAILKLQYNQERNESYRAQYPHGNMEAFSNNFIGPSVKRHLNGVITSGS